MKEFQQPQQDRSLTEKDIEVLTTDGTTKEKKDATFKYLQQTLGLTDAGSAALVGAWAKESNFKLDAENKAEKEGKNDAVKSTQYGIGIGQWTGARHDAFVSYIEKNGGEYNLKNQLDFAITELSRNPELLNHLRTVEDPEEATAYVLTMYVQGQHRNIKDKEDLYNRRDAMVRSYLKKHNKLYGKASNTFDVSLKNTTDYLASLNDQSLT